MNDVMVLEVGKDAIYTLLQFGADVDPNPRNDAGVRAENSGGVHFADFAASVYD